MQVTREFDFDSFIDRENTESLKWDARERRGYPETVLPMWVADMDHRTAPAVVQALHERVAHGIFGYTSPDASYFETVAAWQSRRFGWEVDPMSIVAAGGVIPALAYAVRAFTEPGDGVVIEEPVYYPFRSILENNGRTAVNAPLVRNRKGRYVRDLAVLEATFVASGARTMILCNPHNPVGRVWTREELLGLADLAAKLDALILSDEIHAEMAFPGFRHYPFPTVSDEAAACSILFTAPSKTFNIAGIVSSYAIVPNDRLRQAFYSFLEAGEFNHGTIFAYEATKAAYTPEGAEWRRQMLAYVWENVAFVEAYLRERLPKVKVYRPQASFLVWLDCRGLGLSHDELIQLFVDRARLALNDGAMFGHEGTGFMRLNVGCPRATLQTALDRLTEAVNGK